MSKCILNDCVLWQSHGQRVRIIEGETLFDTDEPRQLVPIVEWLWKDGTWRTAREGNWFAVDQLTWSLEAMTQALAVLANRVNTTFLRSEITEEESRAACEAIAQIWRGNTGMDCSGAGQNGRLRLDIRGVGPCYFDMVSFGGLRQDLKQLFESQERGS